MQVIYFIVASANQSIWQNINLNLKKNHKTLTYKLLQINHTPQYSIISNQA